MRICKSFSLTWQQYFKLEMDNRLLGTSLCPYLLVESNLLRHSILQALGNFLLLTKINNLSINHMIDKKHLAILHIFELLKNFTKARLQCTLFCYLKRDRLNQSWGVFKDNIEDPSCFGIGKPD